MRISDILSRLKVYDTIDLGLVQSELKLTSPHPRWKRAYSDEAGLIFNHVRDESLRLYHIGSTAINGMDAKPIIDILGSVASLSLLEQKAGQLERLGYTSMGEFGISGRRFFVLRSPDGLKNYVHLHIFEHHSSEISRHLQFRDILRNDATAADLYLTKKKDLVAELAQQRDQYPPAKSELIQKLLKNYVPPQEKNLILFGASEGHRNTLTYVQELFSDQSPLVDLGPLALHSYSYKRWSDPAFADLAQKMLAANHLVFATPVYWYAMSAEMKTFVDNFSYLLRGPLKEVGEKLQGKMVSLVSTGSDPVMPFGFEAPFGLMAIYFGMDYMGARYRAV